MVLKLNKKYIGYLISFSLVFLLGVGFQAITPDSTQAQSYQCIPYALRTLYFGPTALTNFPNNCSCCHTQPESRNVGFSIAAGPYPPIVAVRGWRVSYRDGDDHHILVLETKIVGTPSIIGAAGDGVQFDARICFCDDNCQGRNFRYEYGVNVLCNPTPTQPCP